MVLNLIAALLVAGAGHLTKQRQEFQAQVAPWFPAHSDTVGATEEARVLAVCRVHGDLRHQLRSALQVLAISGPIVGHG